MADELQFRINPLDSTQSSEHREIYTNTTKIGLTPWDLRIVFGHAVQKPNGFASEDLVTVVMSPQHAKVLLGAWTKALENYEKMFGEVKDLTAIAATEPRVTS